MHTGYRDRHKYDTDENEKGEIERRRKNSEMAHARWMTIEVDALHHAALAGAFPHQVAKVPERLVALGAHLERLVAAAAQLLDRVLEADAQRVGGDAQDLAHRARDPVAVDVDVVERRELVRNLGAEAVRKRVGDLVEDVKGCCDGYRKVKLANKDT